MRPWALERGGDGVGTSAGLVTSQATKLRRRRRSWRCLAAALALPRIDVGQDDLGALACASRSAQARPMPCAAPVTIATLPASSMLSLR